MKGIKTFPFSLKKKGGGAVKLLTRKINNFTLKNVHLNSLLRQTTIHLFLRVQSHLMFRGFSSNTYLTFLWLKYNINKLPSTMMATSSHFMPFHTMMVGPRCRLDYHSIFLGLAFGYRISFLFWNFDFDAKIYINLKFWQNCIKN